MRDVQKIYTNCSNAILASEHSNELKTSYYVRSVGITDIENLFTNQHATNFDIGGS
jgi:hypothetical protein